MLVVHFNLESHVFIFYSVKNKNGYLKVTVIIIHSLEAFMCTFRHCRGLLLSFVTNQALLVFDIFPAHVCL